MQIARIGSGYNGDIIMWKCPCEGCKKAVAAERQQLLYLLENIQYYEYNQEPYQIVIDLIKARMPKPKKAR